MLYLYLQHPTYKIVLVTSMGSEHPFRFLDLPKELRLIFYNYLPTRTNYHKHDAVQDDATSADAFKLFLESAESESGNNVPHHSAEIIPQVSIVILHKSKPGFAILSTC
jgi:hypothetical protein